jgi:hypothetical protein
MMLFHLRFRRIAARPPASWFHLLACCALINPPGDDDLPAA